MDIHFKFGNQFNSWAMAILAIMMLGVGTFGLIAGVASGGVAVIVVSAVLILSGGVLGVRYLQTLN